VPNKNVEADFWVKEKKNGFYCFAKQSRPEQQSHALKTVASFGKELQGVL